MIGTTGKTGTLSLVAVPIGNADDLTIRAVRTLAEADMIASEDPAATQRLLAQHGLTASITSYGPFHIKEKVAVLIHRLREGAHVALVSDTGSPVIADPGSLLVESARALGIRVVSVPGPSALTAAVAAAGLSSSSFCFGGQLAETKSSLRRQLQTWLQNKTPTVAFCSTQSLVFAVHTLATIAPREQLALVCDLTTPEERIIEGTAMQVLKKLGAGAGIQNVTLILKNRKAVTKRTPGLSKQQHRKDQLSSRRIRTR